MLFKFFCLFRRWLWIGQIWRLFSSSFYSYDERRKVSSARESIAGWSRVSCRSSHRRINLQWSDNADGQANQCISHFPWSLNFTYNLNSHEKTHAFHSERRTNKTEIKRYYRQFAVGYDRAALLLRRFKNWSKGIYQINLWLANELSFTDSCLVDPAGCSKRSSCSANSTRNYSYWQHSSILLQLI